MIEITEKKEDNKQYYVRIDCKTGNHLLIDRSFYIYSGLFGEESNYGYYSIQRYPIKYNNLDRSVEDYLTAIKDQYDKIEKIAPALWPYCTLSKVCVMDSNHKVIYIIRKDDDGEIHVSKSVNVREPNLSTDEMLNKGYITNEEAEMDKGVQGMVKNARLSLILNGNRVEPEPTDEELYEVLCYTRSLFPSNDSRSVRFSYKDHQLILYLDEEYVASYIIQYDMSNAIADYDKIEYQKRIEARKTRLHMIIKGDRVDPEPTEEEWTDVFDQIYNRFSDYDDVSLRSEHIEPGEDCTLTLYALYIYSKGEKVGTYIFPYNIDQALASYTKKINEEEPVDDNDLEDIPENESKTPRDKVKAVALKHANKILIRGNQDDVETIINILVRNDYLVYANNYGTTDTIISYL